MEQLGINLEYEQVKEFHKAFYHPYSDSPTPMSMPRALTRVSWMNEEIDEFLEAVNEGDVVEQADAMIDLMYFSIGTLVEMGVKPHSLFQIVQQANMSKLWEDGKPHYNEDGKVIKPMGWENPHNKLVEEINKQMQK